MLSISSISDSGAAANYYGKRDDKGDEDYYAREDVPAEWYGAGAEKLGLQGAVDRDEFVKILDGNLPNDVQLGRVGQDGEREHKAGWDLTFSAPKSVSILAEVAGDERLVQAHKEAVMATLQHIEERCSQTRVKEAGEIRSETTGNLVVAMFKHETSREMDPQTHTHCVVANATQRSDGQWRSIESHEMYRFQKEAGIIYRHELAIGVQSLGYEIEKTTAGEGKKAAPSFEIRGVEQALMDHFSKRSNQVEQALAEKGIERETATAAQKEVATLGSRSAKGNESRDELRTRWADESRQFQVLESAVQAAKERAFSRNERESAHEAREDASRVVEQAIGHLGEREMTFRATDLEKQARRWAFGTMARESDVQNAIRRQQDIGRLIAQPAPARANNHQDERGFTTKDNVMAEYKLLAASSRGKGEFEAIHGERGARNIVVGAALEGRREGRSWSTDQRRTTTGLLTSTDQFLAIQGAAGAAKTTTVLKTFIREAEKQGYSVAGMAPSGAAAKQLQEGGGVASKTIDGFLRGLERKDKEIQRLTEQSETQRYESSKAVITDRISKIQGSVAKIWIVDEAGMMGTRQAHDLLKTAAHWGSRVVFVGDTKQLASVESGRAFEQMQAAMRTYTLERIVRQENKELRGSVYLSYQDKADQAVEKLASIGGVKEIQDKEARVSEIARHFVALSRDEKDRTLVLDPTREGREALNAAIRTELKRQGALSGNEFTTDTLANKNLSSIERARADAYSHGDRILMGEDDRKSGVKRGEYWEVTGVDRQENRLTLTKDGRSIQWYPGKGGSSEVFESNRQSASAGDKIIWTRNDNKTGMRNSDKAEIVELNGSVARLKDQGGKEFVRDLDQWRHWSLAYAQTVHSAQGRTADRVLANLESGQSSLVHQRSLYVTISRARHEALVYTDSAEGLKNAVRDRTGENTVATMAHHELATAKQLSEPPGRWQEKGNAPFAAEEKTEHRQHTANVTFTTASNIRHNQELEAAVLRGQGAFTPILTRKEARETASHLNFRADQRDALIGIMSSRDRVSVIHGDHENPKVSELVKSIVSQAERRGVAVSNGTVAEHLERSARLEVAIDDKLTAQNGHHAAAQHIREQAGSSGPNWRDEHAHHASAAENAGREAGRELATNRLWIVNQSDPAHHRELNHLVQSAERIGARVVLVQKQQHEAVQKSGEPRLPAKAFHIEDRHSGKTALSDQEIIQELTRKSVTRSKGERNRDVESIVANRQENRTEQSRQPVERTGHVDHLLDRPVRPVPTRPRNNSASHSGQSQNEHDSSRVGRAMERTMGAATHGLVFFQSTESRDASRHSQKCAETPGSPLMHEPGTAIWKKDFSEMSRNEKLNYYLRLGRRGVKPFAWDGDRMGMIAKTYHLQKRASEMSYGKEVSWDTDHRLAGVKNRDALLDGTWASARPADEAVRAAREQQQAAQSHQGEHSRSGRGTHER